MNFRTSETTAKLDAALVKVQSEVDVAEKDKTNPHYRSRYADLASIWRACRDALVKHGVNVTQWPSHGDDDRLHLVTRVAHSGEWMLCHFAMPVSKQDPQGYGSAITYAKRYCLASVLGVVSDEDDDGNTASQRRNGETGEPHPKRAGKDAPATDKQTAFIERLAKSSKLTEAEREGIHKRLLHGMTKKQASDAIEWLEEAIETRDEAPDASPDDLFGGEPQEKNAPSAQGAGA